MLAEDQLAEYGYTRDEYLLATDAAMVVPTGQTVVVQVTAADVIHSWTVPAFGVKQDGVPGRLAELWFEVEPGHGRRLFRPVFGTLRRPMPTCRSRSSP
jgi:cytochrome c oxidase subunit 2